MRAKFLIITLAMNGYQWAYRSHIKTHSDYAKRIGANHVAVSRPRFTLLGIECCWLKLHILKDALIAGYDDVLILDADAWVNDTCPDIRNNEEAGKFIYMAKGYSHRFNSGVLWVKKSKASIEFISTVIDSRLEILPIEDDVGWGENGHIIHFAKRSDLVTELDVKWNNTYKSDIVDYIRHYNHGPFRTLWYSRLMHRLITTASSIAFKLVESLNLAPQHQLPSSWFINELNKILKAYPDLTKPM